MSCIVLPNMRLVVALSAALLGSVISLANPFEWPKDIDFQNVAIELNSSLSLESDSLPEGFIEKTKEYFLKTMARATALAQATSAESETQAQQEALTQLNESVEDLLAQEKDEEKKRTALGAFKEKLVELTRQAKARAQRIVAVDNARKQYVLTKMPEKGDTIAKIAYGILYRGTVTDLQENTKQCVLGVFTSETKNIEKFLNSLPFDKWRTFDSLSHNAMKFCGYFIKTGASFSDIMMSFENSDYLGFAAYKKSVDGAQVLSDKRQVLKHLLSLGETLQEAHNNQLYHGNINENSFGLSKDAWKFTSFGLAETIKSAYADSSSSSSKEETQFLAPESKSITTEAIDPYKLDIFAFAILIQTLMLDEGNARLKHWNTLIKDRSFAVKQSQGATPFTSHLFVKPPSPEPTSKLPKGFIDGMASFAEKDPSKRGSLKDLVELLKNTYDTFPLHANQ